MHACVEPFNAANTHTCNRPCGSTTINRVVNVARQIELGEEDIWPLDACSRRALTLYIPSVIVIL